MAAMKPELGNSAGTALAVSTEGLTKRYGDTCVVDHVDLAVPEHAVYGFLGPNGAGKSTTMKMLLGLVHPSEGAATVLGCPLLPENRLEVLRGVGSLIESPSCYPRLTARENLEIVRRLRGLPKSEIDEVLAIVGLDGPAVHKKAAGVSSHLLSEIDQMADHVGIINRGHMVWQGALEDLHAMGRRWIALRTTDNRLAAQLLPGAETDPNDRSYLRIKAVDDREAARVSLGLAGRGVGIVRMEGHEETLEDIFLRLTSLKEVL